MNFKLKVPTEPLPSPNLALSGEFEHCPESCKTAQNSKKYAEKSFEILTEKF